MAPDLLVNSMVVVCLCFWGAWGIFDKKALEVTSPLGQLVATYYFSPVFALVLFVGMSILSPGWHLPAQTLYYQALCSIAYIVGTIGYLVAMSRKEASTIIGATATYPVATQIFATVFLGESLVVSRLIGGCLVVTGVMALSGMSLPLRRNVGTPGNRTQASAADEYSGLNCSRAWHRPLAAVGPEPRLRSFPANEMMVATIAAPQLQADNVMEILPTARPDILVPTLGVVVAIVGWGLRGIFDKMSLATTGPFEVNLGKLVCDTVLGAMLLCWMSMGRGKAELVKPALWGPAFGSALCLAGGSAAYYIAMSRVSASYVVAITGCYPLLMYMLAILILKERFNSSRAIGIGLITIGGIITQATQSL